MKRPMSSDRRPVAGHDVQKHFRLGGGYRVATGRFLVLHAVSLCLVLAGMSSFVLTLGDVLNSSGLATIDGPLTDWFVDHRTDTATVVMAGFAFVFGPAALPVIILVAVVAWALVTR